MIKWINKVKGLITIEIDGFNVERLLNKIVKHRINIISCKRLTSNISEITILDSDKIKLDKLLKREYKVSISSTSKSNNIYKFLFGRYGFVVGVIVAMICFTFLSGKVWSIKVTGIETINTYEIIELLNEVGIDKGVKMKEINTEEVESLILEKIQEVSLVSVIKIGSTIAVNIKEKVRNNEDENITAIVSDFDGIINNVELIQGTCLVKSGDVVKRGDVLVDCYTYDGDNNIIPVQAKANIYATIWVKGEIVFDENEIKFIRSGNYYTKETLNMFGLNMSLKRRSEKYNYYEIEKYSKNICKNTLIPFTIIEEKIYELVMIEEKKSFKEEKDSLIKKSIYLAYDNLNTIDNLNIISEQTDIIQVGTKYYITTYIKLTKKIGVSDD